MRAASMAWRLACGRVDAIDATIVIARRHAATARTASDIARVRASRDHRDARRRDVPGWLEEHGLRFQPAVDRRVPGHVAPEHVVLHHMHTGDVHMDPDAQMAPAMRGYSGSMYLPWMVLQHYYFFVARVGVLGRAEYRAFFGSASVVAIVSRVPLVAAGYILADAVYTLAFTVLCEAHRLPSLVAIRASTADEVFRR